MTNQAVEVFDQNGPIASTWTYVTDEQDLAHTGPQIVSISLYASLKASGSLPAQTDLGLLVEAGEDMSPLSGDISNFALIALTFPSFADGRSYSTARLLRERLHFTGDLRATGDVLIDQIPHMLRCGFSSFEVAHGPTQARLRQGHPPALSAHEVPNYYQPAGDETATVAGRAWARRRSH